MIDLTELRRSLGEAQVDGWLLFDFHGLNPVAGRVLGLKGMNTRRLFVLLPREGEPVAVAHKIELQGLEGFPGRVVPYARWSELHTALAPLVSGRRLAMEISPDDAVPYLDRVPYGVIELLRRLGATIVPSGSLVSRFAARWSAAEADDHRAAAEILASVARASLRKAVHESDTGLTESALQARVVAEVETRGLVFDTHPIVAFGPNSAQSALRAASGKGCDASSRGRHPAGPVGRSNPNDGVCRSDLDRALPGLGRRSDWPRFGARCAPPGTPRLRRFGAPRRSNGP